MKAKVIIDRRLVLGATSRFVAEVEVLLVSPGKRYPSGIKARFVLLDTENGVPRLLIDNHEPYGFHVHRQLPDDHSQREVLKTTDHEEGLEMFLIEAERIVRNEEE